MQIRTRILTAAASVAAVAAVAMPTSALAEPAVALNFGNGTGQQLSFFDTARPLETTKVTITGLATTTEYVSDLDVRPANGGIYISTTENTDSQANLLPDLVRLYSVNPTNGAATLLGGAPSITDLPDNATVSIDFNPSVDRIRVIATTGENYRVHPDTGALVQKDTTVTPGTPNIVSNAYDRSVVGTTATTLYALDGTTDSLVTIGGVNSTPSPNGGVASVVGPLGYDVDTYAGFDISPATNVAYLVSAPQNAAQSPQLRTVNLTTGATTLVATIDAYTAGFALLAPSTIALATNAQIAEERAGRVEVMVVRTGSTTLPGSVNFATKDGTATSVNDYTATSGTLRFAAGETTKTIVIPVNDDGTGDDKETFSVNLSDAAGASLATPSSIITTVETSAADKTAPGTVISDLGLKAYKYFFRSGLKTTYSCSEACTSVYTVRLGTTGYLAKGTGELRTNGVGVATAPITLLGKARLNAAFKKTRASMIRAQFTIQTTDASGNKRVMKRYFFILR